jgi:hypothetical protein
MVRNIFPDNFCGYFVANGAGKISIFPKLSSPQLFLYFRVLREYGADTDALQHSYHLGDTISGRKRQKNMDMVFCDLKGIYLKIMILGYLFKYLFYSISDVCSQDPLSVFRDPHQMVFGIIDCMAGSFKLHAVDIAYLSLPSAGELFIPVYKTGYSSSGFA